MCSLCAHRRKRDSRTSGSTVGPLGRQCAVGQAAEREALHPRRTRIKTQGPKKAEPASLRSREPEAQDFADDAHGSVTSRPL